MDGYTLPVEATAWLELVQAVSLCGRQLRKALAELAAPHQLSDTEVLILWACCDASSVGLGQHELATLVGISPAQLSGLVDRLSAQDLLIGRRPAHDRRRQYWRLTANGQRLMVQLAHDLAQRSTDSAEHPVAEGYAVLNGPLSALAAVLAQRSLPRSQEAA
jgi:DNA-binding MarR family transcriptional regulator